MGLCGSTNVAAPPARDVGKEYRDTLRAQMEAHLGIGDFADVGSLPDMEANARPGYVDLELSTLERMMTGSDGQKGLLNLYRDDIYPAAAEMERQAKLDRAATDRQILDEHGAGTTEAIRKASGNSRIMELLRSRAEEELGTDGRLSAADRREHEQSARSAQAARGMGHGNNDAFMEAMQVGAARERRRREQQGFAQNVAAQLQATGGDPMLALTGRASQTMGLGTQFAGQGQAQSNNLGTQLFNPESAYAADAYKSNYQGQLAANQATASNNAAMTGALFQGIGSIGGGLASMCWVAREVYGADNPDWLRFRHWLLTQAPRWFVALYILTGERVAKLIKGQGRIKSWIRQWMDSKIKAGGSKQ